MALNEFCRTELLLGEEGINKLKKDVNKAGNVLNKAKTEIEKELERHVVTTENYIALTDDKK